MERRKKHLLIWGSILLAILLAVGGVLGYTAHRLPDSMTLPMFCRGMIEVELLGQEVCAVAPEQYFYRDDDAMLAAMERRGYLLTDQAGAGYLFEKDGEPVKGISECVTRRHKLITFV